MSKEIRVIFDEPVREVPVEEIATTVTSYDEEIPMSDEEKQQIQKDEAEETELKKINIACRLHRAMRSYCETNGLLLCENLTSDQVLQFLDYQAAPI